MTKLLNSNHLKIYALCFGFFVLNGCLPVIWATPPIKAEAGIGVSPEQTSGVAYPLRVGVHPLQLFPALLDRKFDAGVGYQVWLGDRLPGHGMYLDASYMESFGYWRLFGTAKLQFLTRNGLWGVGGGGQLGVEFYDFADGPFDSCDDMSEGCGVGYGTGEFSIGPFIEGSRIVFDEETITFVGIGLQARLPASVGLALVPLWEFLD